MPSLSLCTVVTHASSLTRLQARLQAARDQRLGQAILTLEQLALKLAGGFSRPITHAPLAQALNEVFAQGELGDLQGIVDLPGTASALAHTFLQAWKADFSFQTHAASSSRVAYFANLEQRVLKALPTGLLSPAQLLTQAMERLHLAPRLFGPVTLTGLSDIEPCWRPLLLALAKHTPVTWHYPFAEAPPWLENTSVQLVLTPAQRPTLQASSAANPYDEALEAMRWVHALLLSGVKPEDIALTSNQPALYEDAFRALREQAAFELHFPHGVSLLTAYEGQQISALSDLVNQGINKARLLRLAALCHNCPPIQALPEGWRRCLPQTPMSTPQAWRAFISRLPHHPLQAELGDLSSLGALLTRLLDTSSLDSLGAYFFKGARLAYWQRACHSGGLSTLSSTFERLRKQDEVGSLASVIWAPAHALAAQPRPYVRLLGLNAQQWPRPLSDDSFLPSHLLGFSPFTAFSHNHRDKDAFTRLHRHTSHTLALSWSRRDPTGRALDISPLVLGLGLDASATHTSSRVCWSESEFFEQHLAAFSRQAHAQKALACWQHWQGEALSPSDGLIRAEHPLILEALSRPQSASSLELLLQDPQRFVWRHILGWREPEESNESLFYRAADFGSVVHALIELTRPHLGPQQALPPDTLLEQLLERSLGERPPLTQALKQGFLNSLKPLLSHAFSCSDEGQHHHELSFGGHTRKEGTHTALWDNTHPLTISGTEFTLRGVIDCVSISSDGSHVQVIDYKTGKAPSDKALVHPSLQLQLYGFAVQSLLASSQESAPQLTLGLAYLKDRKAPTYAFSQLSDELIHWLKAGNTYLKAGVLAPSPNELKAATRDFTLARPADRNTTYLTRKTQALADARPELVSFWERYA